MRILLVNKFHYLNGGSEKYYFELGKLLKEKGNQVAYFSMEDERNIKTGDEEYFVKKIDLNKGSKLKAFDVIYSKENYKKMKEAINEFKPDIVHLNNFQRQLSASIVKACNEMQVPVVFTAHDMQAICPAISMLDAQKNICEECMNGKYINCIRKKCVKGSTLKSVLGAIEGFHYKNKKIYTDKISYIITPSIFYKDKLKKEGFQENKLKAIHNFIDLKDYELETIDNGYALYFGRLAKEKGIINLIKAFSKLDKGSLYIAGDGPEKEKIKNMIKENNLENRVKMLGFLNPDQMKDAIRKSKFVVIPSIWYENCPYSVIETLAIGKPVVGADIAGIPELVKNGISGLTYGYDDVSELAQKMNLLFENESLANKYGKNAKKQAYEEYDKDIYYNELIEVYEKVRIRK